MKFARDGIQREVADAARELLASAWSFERVRELEDGPFPEDLWRQLDELGWFELIVPEDRDGLGLGPIEAGAIFEEAGRHLLPGPLFDNVVVNALGGFDRGRIAFAGEDGIADSADAVESVVAVVAHDDAHTLVAVPAADASPRRLRSTDYVARPFEVDVDGGDVVGDETLLAAIREWALVMTASRALGVIDRIVEMSVEYAKQREQFGRPIGAFQAVQHRLADMATLAVASRSVCYGAQWALATDADDAGKKARVAKAYVSRAVREVAESGIQVHGGVGFTHEHDLHLLVKHALTLERAWGDAGEHEDALADALLQDSAVEAGA